MARCQAWRAPAVQVHELVRSEPKEKARATECALQRVHLQRAGTLSVLVACAVDVALRSSTCPLASWSGNDS